MPGNISGIKVMKSAAGYYLGRSIGNEPFCRSSVEYWFDLADAQKALETGNWLRRESAGGGLL